MNALFVKRGRALVCLFFVAILLLGLCTVGDYGRYWDELSELRIFRMAVMEYAQTLPIFANARLALESMGVEPLSQSVEMDHNFSLYYPLAGLVCDPGLDVNRLSMIWRGYTWAIFTFGLYCLYAVCRRMGLSRPLCCVAALLLLLSPRFFAQGHYNNKDIPLMTLTALVLWQTLRLREKPTFPRAFLFGLAAGLCVNTRIIGGAICALCGGMLLLTLWWEKRLTRRVWAVAGCALLCALAWYALLTPALLQSPAAYLRYVVKSSYSFNRWNGTMLFMGREIDMASGKPPWYYLPVTIALTTPLLQLALAFYGGGATLSVIGRSRRKKGSGAGAALLTEPGQPIPQTPEPRDGFAPLLCLLLWTLPLLCAMVLRVRVYNGWRHFYFLYPPLIATAAWGAERLWRRARPGRLPRRAMAVGLACVLVFQTVSLALNHPNQYAYYNPLVPRDSLEERYELDYWNVSVLQALRALEALAGTEGPIAVACTDPRTRTGYAFATTMMTQEENDRFVLTEYAEEDQNRCYLLANSTYLALSGFQVPEDMRPVISVRAYGADLCVLYACDSTEVSP